MVDLASCPRWSAFFNMISSMEILFTLNINLWPNKKRLPSKVIFTPLLTPIHNSGWSCQS